MLKIIRWANKVCCRAGAELGAAENILVKINLTKYVRDMYTEKCKSLMREIEEDK